MSIAIGAAIAVMTRASVPVIGIGYCNREILRKPLRVSRRLRQISKT